MKSTKHKPNPMKGLVAAGALFATSVGVTAEPITKSLEMICPFPLIGDQKIVATIKADYPKFIQAGQTLGPIVVDTITTVPDKARQGLAFVDATTITGTAESFNTFHTASRTIPNNTLLTIEPTDVPSNTSGPFDVPAIGEAPAVTFESFDFFQDDILLPITLTVDDLVLHLTNLKADGTVAPDPVGKFTSDCTLVEGQDNTLAVIDPVISGKPIIEITPSEVDFGERLLGDFSTQSIKISNAGTVAYGISALLFEGDSALFTTTHNCSSILVEGESCTANITYLASEVGSHSLELILDSPDVDVDVPEVSVKGITVETGVPGIEVHGNLDFGEVKIGETKTSTIEIRSVGTAPLEIFDIGVSGSSGSFSLISADGCDFLPPPGPLAVIINCFAEVQFAPLEVGVQSGVFTIVSNIPGGNIELAMGGSGKDKGCDGSSVLPISLSVNGETHLATSGGELALNGQVNTDLNLCSGEFEGELHINPTQGSFEIIEGWSRYQATAHVEFENVGQTTGSLINGTLVATSQAYVKIPKVTKTLFGFINWPIGGGENCRTKEPVTFTVASEDGQFDAINGGMVTGVYDLPELENCGLLTSILNGKMAGPGNTINLEMTPIFD